MTTEGEGLLLLLVLLLAAERLQLGEYGIDVEIVAGPLRGFVLVLLGGFGGRQQSGAAIGRVDRLFLGRARDLEIELDLRAEAEGDGIDWRSLGGGVAG